MAACGGRVGKGGAQEVIGIGRGRGTSEALGGLPQWIPSETWIHFPSKVEVVIQFPRAVDWIREAGRKTGSELSLLQLLLGASTGPLQGQVKLTTRSGGPSNPACAHDLFGYRVLVKGPKHPLTVGEGDRTVRWSAARGRGWIAMEGLRPAVL